MRVPRPIVLFALAAAAAAAGGCGNGSRGKTGVNLIQARYGHTQTTLPDGRVVLIGGVKRSDAGTRDTLVSEVAHHEHRRRGAGVQEGVPRGGLLGRGDPDRPER
jgi:hypothetical protein